MRTKTEQASRRTVAERRSPLPPPGGIAILSGRTKAEIGRVRRDGSGWTVFAPGDDGTFRSLGVFADFATALAAVPDPLPQPVAVAAAAPVVRRRPQPAKAPAGPPAGVPAAGKPLPADRSAKGGGAARTGA